MNVNSFEVIVIGGGHAGVEAACAAAKSGLNTLLMTINLDTIARLSCNPAIGGLGKSHLAAEVDALGGIMGFFSDRSGIQYRTLNKKKGPAVQATRIQIDRLVYHQYVKKYLEDEPNITLCQDLAEELIIHNGIVTGVKTQQQAIYKAKAVVLTTGTFLQGKIFVGNSTFNAGRAGEIASLNLSHSLSESGLLLSRFKTGTPARIDGKTIDYSRCAIQEGESDVQPLSFWTKKIDCEQIPCWLTYSNNETHDIISKNIDKAPLYSGLIKGAGPRYCPSIEAKILRFPDKEKHQVFLEPEGRQTNEYYVNGMSNGLPHDVQIAFLRTIPGLENVSVTRFAYAIEYDFIQPTQLKLNLETRKVKGLFCAGQINGSSGYEEAAAQGIMAGINAAAYVKNNRPLILKRSEAYIGVLIDDLVTKGVAEPYRMFTSRAEYRLLLRQDNATLRLCDYGYERGLISEDQYREFENFRRTYKKEYTALQKTTVSTDAFSLLEKEKKSRSGNNNGIKAFQLLQRPEITINDFLEARVLNPDLPEKVYRQLEISIKYAGYIKKQKEDAEKFLNLEKMRIPNSINYFAIDGLPMEAKEQLSSIRPENLGQASRISGVTPSDIMTIMIRLKKKNG